MLPLKELKPTFGHIANTTHEDIHPKEKTPEGLSKKLWFHHKLITPLVQIHSITCRSHCPSSYSPREVSQFSWLSNPALSPVFVFLCQMDGTAMLCPLLGSKPISLANCSYICNSS